MGFYCIDLTFVSLIKSSTLSRSSPMPFAWP